MGMNDFGFGPGQDIDRMYAQYKQTQQMLAQQQMQFQQMQAPQFAPQQGNPAMGQRGMFVQVHDYSEVVQTPVPISGTPMLFFCFEQGIFWSKKIVDGQPRIQPFTFNPLSNAQEQKQPTEMPETKENDEPINSNILSVLLDKIEALETTVANLTPPKDTVTEPKAKTGGKA